MNLVKSIIGVSATLFAYSAFASGAIDLGNITLPDRPPSEGSMPIGNAFIHKSVQGTLNESALESLARLQNYANAKGPVKVWVTFKMAFEADPSLRTGEVIAAEAQARQFLIETQINPLVEAGLVELLQTPAYLYQAPGCLVKATDQGLGELAYSGNIQHIKTMR